MAFNLSFFDNRSYLFIICLVSYVCSTAFFGLNNILAFFLRDYKKEMALPLVRDVDTRWNSTYLMLERLKKIKSSVRYYVANYKKIKIRLLNLKNRKLVNHIDLLLEPFSRKECSKYNALLSSVIPHARSLTKFEIFMKIQKMYQMFVNL